jgi:hypothetical protein
VTGHARRRAATGLAGHPTIESPEARLEHIRRRATAPGRRSNGGIIQNDLIGEIGEGAPAGTVYRYKAARAERRQALFLAAFARFAPGALRQRLCAKGFALKAPA